MIWSKLKQLLESYLSPALIGRVEYSSTSYRYLPDKAGTCNIMVDKRNVFNMADTAALIKWYQTEQELKSDPNIQIHIRDEEIEGTRKAAKGPIPEERLIVITRNRKLSEYAKELLAAQTALSKSNFNDVASKFLAISIDESLESDHILLNTLALVDRRVGKKRLLNMADKIALKHPIVKYFYELRLSTY